MVRGHHFAPCCRRHCNFAYYSGGRSVCRSPLKARERREIFALAGNGKTIRLSTLWHRNYKERCVGTNKTLTTFTSTNKPKRIVLVSCPINHEKEVHTTTEPSGYHKMGRWINGIIHERENRVYNNFAKTALKWQLVHNSGNRELEIFR